MHSLTTSTLLTLLKYICIVLCCLANLAQANNANWNQSRKDYKIALEHLNKGKKNTFERYRNELEDNLYPLAPYLTYYEYRRNLTQVPDEEIITFIDQNWDSPIGSQLKQRWLKQLATQKNWSAFIEHFVPEEDAKSAALLCNQASALLNKGQHDLAFAAAKKLWLVGRSQSKSCDPVFNAWREAGYLTDDLIWQRLELTMERGNLNIARYLAKQLKSKALQQDYFIWQSLFNSPHQLKNKINDFEDTPRHRNIILHVLTRWVRSDKPNTLKYLTLFGERYNFTHAEKNRYVSYIARYVSFTFHPQSYYWLLEVDMQNKDQKVQDKRLEVALRAQDWPAVILWASQPTKSVWEASRFKYWKARGFEALAQQQSERLLTQRWPHVNKESIFYIHRLYRAALSTDLGAEFIALGNAYQPVDAWKMAQDKYHEISSRRDFYGFLASDKLNKTLSLNDYFEPVAQSLFQTVANIPGFQRARELFMMKDKSQAYREWRHTLKRLPTEQIGVAARVAESWGWSYQAIVTASKSTEQNNLELRFPKTYKGAVAYQAHKNEIDTSWVFAVIRQESAFRAEARSGVGAMGLMQIMPATARHLSRGLGIKAPKKSQLLSANYNIKLGTHYLRELYDEFGGSIVMATAAYNAGPHRVKEWRPTDVNMPGDIWIETIPFKETREYVKNIMTYQAIYKYRMGLVASLSNDVKVVRPKSAMPIIQLPTQLVKAEQ